MSHLEALGRALEEIAALEAIFDEDFVVKSSDSDLQQAQSAVNTGEEAAIPRLNVELQVGLQDGRVAKLQCGMPPGYPEECALIVALASMDGLSRTAREEISEMLNTKAESLVGQEAVMELVQEFQDVSASVIEKYVSSEKDTDSKTLLPSGFGRRWIWAHHINDTGRRKSIVQEARDLALGGYLKPGYPGIVVIEGEKNACDDFVTWIKGSKSRPGGFGRNWGHHVKGQIDFPTDVSRHLPNSFEEVEADMAVFGACCKDCGLESNMGRASSTLAATMKV